MVSRVPAQITAVILLLVILVTMLLMLNAIMSTTPCVTIANPLKNVLWEIKEQIRNVNIAFYSKDHQEDILYDFVKAKQSTLDWKAHILRSCNQEKAKQDLLQNLNTSEAIVGMDWAMKFQQMKFREKQSEWFGQRGLSWHRSNVICKEENRKEGEVQSYAHLFNTCTQDWYAVASILENLLVKFKSTHPSIPQVYLSSDEVCC